MRVKKASLKLLRKCPSARPEIFFPGWMRLMISAVLSQDAPNLSLKASANRNELQGTQGSQFGRRCCCATFC